MFQRICFTFITLTHPSTTYTKNPVDAAECAGVYIIQQLISLSPAVLVS